LYDASMLRNNQPWPLRIVFHSEVYAGWGYLNNPKIRIV
jgi:hypothetical protein